MVVDWRFLLGVIAGAGGSLISGKLSGPEMMF
jgi:hypothetical protein